MAVSPEHIQLKRLIKEQWTSRLLGEKSNDIARVWMLQKARKRK